MLEDGNQNVFVLDSRAPLPEGPLNAMVVHDRILGMGQFPEDPITVYLARSTSALCGMYGLLGLLMARNIQKYEGLIYLHGRTLLVVCMIGVYLAWECGLPLAWVIIDGIGGAALGIVTIYLHQQARLQPSDTDN